MMTYLIKSVWFSIFSFLLCAFLLLLFLLREIVLKLLQYEASTNVADNKGYFPIHLAAWKGDEEIVKILIHQGPSHSRVNEQVHLSSVCSCYTFSRVLRRQRHKWKFKLFKNETKKWMWKDLITSVFTLPKTFPLLNFLKGNLKISLAFVYST